VFAIWRRLDVPGHDACRLIRSAEQIQLSGCAIFAQPVATLLMYEVTCDPEWRALRGMVSGWQGPREIHHEFVRQRDAEWTHNDQLVQAVSGCVDLDFAFTPATNRIQLERLQLAIGQSADAPAAWFDLEDETLKVLPQRYERRTEFTYWYEAPTVGYAAELQIAASGFVARYPGLWEAS